MTDAPRDRALARLESSWTRHLDDLVALSRIPGISARPAPDPDVARSAAAVAKLLARAGLERAEVIEFPGGHPYAYAEWLHAEGAPTVLLYGHHDVQPPGDPARWRTPPFEPTFGDDGRLYGRGVVDDKAGVMTHVAACAAWLEGAGELPLNVKFIVEGEEEAGSNSLEAFLTEYRERLAADVIVLTDTSNLEAGIPSVTTSLRGLAAVVVEVRALTQPVHSGMWGGALPDPVIALSKALAGLVEEDGRPAAFLRRGVRPLSRAERTALEALPFDEARFRQQGGVVGAASLIGAAETPVYGRIWREPSVTVVALEARPLRDASNQIVEAARAKVSVRVVADQDPEEVTRALEDYFAKAVPWGLEVTVEREKPAAWWATDPTGPAFDAARRAMEAGYGRPAVMIGCGGSIPFVDPFARVLGGVPALLTGVEDPDCHAHSENESLHVEDWKRGTRAAVHLYAELALALSARTTR